MGWRTDWFIPPPKRHVPTVDAILRLQDACDTLLYHVNERYEWEPHHYQGSEAAEHSFAEALDRLTEAMRSVGNIR